MIYIVIALAVAVLFLLLHRPTKEKVKQVSSDVVGVCAVALERSSQKETRKSRVLELLAEHGELGNEDIREYLGVSRNTVIRYMNELEAEGKAKQIGVTGHAVVYRLSDT
jgi:predicted HTH transcriptional regulator